MCLHVWGEWGVESNEVCRIFFICIPCIVMNPCHLHSHIAIRLTSFDRTHEHIHTCIRFWIPRPHATLLSLLSSCPKTQRELVSDKAEPVISVSVYTASRCVTAPPIDANRKCIKNKWVTANGPRVSTFANGVKLFRSISNRQTHERLEEIITCIRNGGSPQLSKRIYKSKT